MALRKDKIQSLKNSLCLDNVDPATASALNNLVDNLTDLFGDLAAPEFPNFGSNLGDLPGLAPFDFPLGAGSQPDILGVPGGGGENLIEAPPGGGGGGGGGGGNGDGGGGGGGDGSGEQPPPCVVCEHELPGLPETTILLGAASGDIPGADEETGEPGIGLLSVDELTPPEGEDEKYKKCVNDCFEEYRDDIEGLRELLATEGLLEAQRNSLKNNLSEKMAELRLCVSKCEKRTPSPTGETLIVKNISCEKIEADTRIIAGGVVCYDISAGDCRIVPGGEDLWVLVEACGCDG
tara:strand:+ start:1269 stop:2147 length:879 start_codon:yes stop_codon:yes gene_type:complete